MGEKNKGIRHQGEISDGVPSRDQIEQTVKALEGFFELQARC